MTDILLCSLITSLFCLGLKISTGEDMALNKVKIWLDKIFITEVKTGIDTFHVRIGMEAEQIEGKEVTISKWYYPILWCIKCMPSIYGTAIALLLLPFHVELIYQIPLVIFCSVTLNCIFYQMYE